jgi:hypothetical protein
LQTIQKYLKRGDAEEACLFERNRMSEDRNLPSLNEVTKNEVTKNEVTKNEVTKNEVTKNEVTKNEVTKLLFLQIEEQYKNTRIVSTSN